MTSGLSSSGNRIRRRTIRFERGFTLLEVMAVMAIMILLVGITAFAYKEVGDEGTVRRPGNELVRLSKLAVRAAAVQGHGFWIAFEEEGFRLVGSEDEEGEWEGHRLPEGMKMAVRRWGQEGWQQAEGYRWLFGAQGLCEPIWVRFEAADSILEMRFNPLTGGVAEERMEFR